MFRLTAKSGLTKGASWPIGEIPLVVGRGSECQVRIPDPIISRRHFEITIADNVLHIKDLGSLNPVLLNGKPTAASALSVGDEVRIGPYSFLITQNGNGTGPDPSVPDDRTTGTLAEQESVFLTSRKPEGASEVQPKTDEDLNELFLASRTFSRVTSIPELIDVIKEDVSRRFQPDAAWLCLFRAAGEETINLVRPRSDTGQNAAGPPRENMTSALTERRGALFSRHIDRDGQHRVKWVLTAPIFLGELQVGVLALERESAGRPYDKRDLHFLVALAHIVAPFFKAIERVEQLETENKYLRFSKEKLTVLVGSSKVMGRLHQMIQVAAPSQQPVLILGATGTGKELVAALIHELSSRAKGPFITVNCAATPRDLFESEFFGHEKGAFTGAGARKIGLLEQSNNGTLFLDEIGDLALEHQARILRAVETGRFRRVGGEEEIAADFRVVAATNKELSAEIQNGRFRQDLYHRLRAVEVRVPLLNQRRCDIPELAQHFLEATCRKTNSPQRHLSPQAIEYLVGLPWPGNVRELKNTVEVANTFCRSNVIEVDELRAIADAHDTDDVPMSLEVMERLHILKTFEYTDGNIAKTAKLLGMGRSTLYGKLAQYGIK